MRAPTRRLRVFASLSLIVLLGGCPAQVLFVGDPALRATVDLECFERSVADAAREVGLRAAVVWSGSANLREIDMEATIAGYDARTVALSPYASLFASDLAERFSERRFIAYYDGPASSNVVRVEFDPTNAMQEAGEVLAEWVFGSPGRSVTLLVDESRQESVLEAQAFETGYEAAGGVPLSAERFGSPPSRDEVRARLDRTDGEGENAVVVMLGAEAAAVYEILRDDDVALGGRHLRPAGEDSSVEDGRVLFGVRDDLAFGLRAAVAAGEGAVIVPSTLELSPELVGNR